MIQVSVYENLTFSTFLKLQLTTDIFPVVLPQFLVKNKQPLLLLAI